MREVITVQVGQAGNQLGYRFWEKAYREHREYSAGVFDAATSAFFRQVDDSGADVPVGRGGRGSPLQGALKARSVIVDMEETVVNALVRGPLGGLFDAQQLIRGFGAAEGSGSGNNWAVGHCQYGPQYREELIETVRRPAEACDSLQGFFLLHSLGGGTGSGLGTYILRMLEDEFGEPWRFSVPIFPSADDDVVTSPYNSVLALHQLSQHADCVIPVENEALLRMAAPFAASPLNSQSVGLEGGAEAKGRKGVGVQGRRSSDVFSAMNDIAASMFLNLTASARFDGMLNVDLNEVCMNLVPFPGLHYLVGSLTPSPLLVHAGRRANVAGQVPRNLDQLMNDAFRPESCLVSGNPRQGTYLACALMFRGAVDVSDVTRGVLKIRNHLRVPRWSADGFKVGLCAKPSLGAPASLLCLSNNTCLAHTFQAMVDRFAKLYQRRVYAHHYEGAMGHAELEDAFESALNNAKALSDLYGKHDTGELPGSWGNAQPRGDRSMRFAPRYTTTHDGDVVPSLS